MTRPLFCFGRVEGDKVMAGLAIELGTITEAHFSNSNRDHKPMRHIRVMGTNGAAYHGRYCAAKGETVWLKRSAPKRVYNPRLRARRRAR